MTAVIAKADLLHFVPKNLQFKISECKKLHGQYCCAVSCSNAPVASKGGLCHKHYHRKRKIQDPVYDRFVNFRGNAIRRGKEFTITLEQFREFCAKTGYILKKRMRGKLATIDRIDNSQGYHIDNIQILTMKANLAKYTEVDRFELSEECPF